MSRRHAGVTAGFTLLVFALVFAIPQTGYGQEKSSSEKKISLGTVMILDHEWVGPQGEQPAGVVCETLQPCEIIDPMLDAPQPAILIELEEQQTVHIEADITEGHGCLGEVQTAMGDLTIGPGLVRVFIRFDPPFPEGTELSLAWRIGACDPLACADYTIGFEPKRCPK